MTYSLPESETASILASASQIEDMTSENYVFACDGNTFRLIRSRVSSCDSSDNSLCDS